MPPQTFHKRRLVGLQPESVTNVSNTEYPGHYPDEDHSWKLAYFKKVRPFKKVLLPNTVVVE